jgi:hypothetical protein
MIHINAESANPEVLVKELEALGCTIIAQRLASSWNNKPPETLVIASYPDWSTSLSRSLRRIAENHGQDCIAVRFKHNTGITVGSKPVAFNEEYFNVA